MAPPPSLPPVVRRNYPTLQCSSPRLTVARTQSAVVSHIEERAGRRLPLTHSCARRRLPALLLPHSRRVLPGIHVSQFRFCRRGGLAVGRRLSALGLFVRVRGGRARIVRTRWRSAAAIATPASRLSTASVPVDAPLAARAPAINKPVWCVWMFCCQTSLCGPMLDLQHAAVGTSHRRSARRLPLMPPCVRKNVVAAGCLTLALCARAGCFPLGSFQLIHGRDLRKSPRCSHQRGTRAQYGWRSDGRSFAVSSTGLSWMLLPTARLWFGEQPYNGSTLASAPTPAALGLSSAVAPSIVAQLGSSAGVFYLAGVTAPLSTLCALCLPTTRDGAALWWEERRPTA